MKKIGIIGYGEIGKALEKVYEFNKIQPLIRDVERDDNLKRCDVLNISIPYSDNFNIIVSDYIQEISPRELVIIHSTVAPNTTKQIRELSGYNSVVHSPVRGVHPNLYEGIMTFVKFVGADDPDSAERCLSHFDSLGIIASVSESSLTTEMGKLFDTTYYGLCIAWHGEMKKICDELNISFDECVTYFNESYNKGYSKLDKGNVIRPVLNPPSDKIGGHCIIPNTEILKKNFKSSMFDSILEYK